jgi:hypothetical protein
MYYDITWTPAAANLTGYYSNMTGVGPFTMTASVSGDGMAHKVTLRNDTANSKAGITFTLTGTDAAGKAQTEAMAGPGVSATVTSVKFFLTLTSITVSGTLGADTVDAGWDALSLSPLLRFNDEVSALPAFQAVVTGTVNFDIATTLADVFRATNVGDDTFTNDTNWTAKTASVAPTALATRARFGRIEVNSVTGGATIRLIGSIPER